MFELGTADDYHELNAGAHRKPPKILSAPSLIWHLAFWTNFQERDVHNNPILNEDESPKKKTPEQIRNTIDDYILSLRLFLLSNPHVDAAPAVVSSEAADQDRTSGIGAAAKV